MRFLLVLGGVAGLLLAAAFLGPMLYDWNRFKPEIEAKLAEALGREVRIEGPVSLSLIPGPRFSAADLTIANLGGGSDPVMARVRQLRLNLVPLPLVTGAIRVDSLVLDRPAILLEQVAGKPNWIFGAEAAPAGSPAGRGIRPPAPDREEASADFGLDRVLIREGALTWRGQGPEIRLLHLGADVKAGSLTGPFEAKGSLVAGNVPIAFTAASGAFAPDRGTPLAVDVRLQRSEASVRFNGLVSNLSGGRAVRGKLVATAQSLDEAAREMGFAGPLPVPARGKAVLEGELQGNEKEIAVNALALRIGDTVANGALTLLPQAGPQIDLAVALPNLNLDKWLAQPGPAAGKAASAPAANPGRTPQPQAGSSSPASPLQFGLELPAGLDATIDLSAEGVVWRNQALRQVSLHAGLQNGRLQVHQGLATLPAGSELRFNGIFEDPGLPVGKGALEMRSDNLRGLLSWLGVAMPDVPADRLRRFVLASGWEVSGDLVSFGNVDAALDTSRLSGTGTIRFGARPSYALDAVIDNVNADAYHGAPQPLPHATPAPGKAAQPPAAPPAGAQSPMSFLAGLADFDAEIKLAVRQVLWGTNVASGVAVDGTLSNGRLTLRDASVADLAGGSASLSGDLEGLAGTPTLAGLNFDVVARQPARLMRVVGLDGSADWSRFGQMELKGTVSGSLDKLGLDATLAAGGGRIAAKGEVVGLPGDPAGELAVALDHPSVVQLAGLFGDYRPSNLPGPVALKGTLIADGGRLSLSDMEGRIGDLTLGGSLLADWTARPRFEAALTAGDISVDALLPARSSAALPRRNPAIAPIALAQPIATAPASEGPPWSAEPVDLSFLTQFDGKLAVTAKSLAWDGMAFDKPVLSVALDEGRATLEQFDAGLYGGQFGLTGAMDVGSSIRTIAKVALVDAEIREAMKGGGGIAVTSGKLNAAAEIATSGNSTHEWASHLSGQGRFAVREGTVEGFDLPEVNRRLGNIENMASILGLLQAGLSGGQTRFESLHGTFKAEEGVLVSEDLRLQADGGNAAGKVRIDLPRYMLNARTEIRVGAASDAPPLGLRLEGPLDSPRKFIDMNELQAHLLAKGMGRLLRGRSDTPVQQAPSAAVPAPDQGAENPKPPAARSPDDLVRELLKSLGR